MTDPVTPTTNAADNASERPNVLWICTDQQRADTVHALGNPGIRTPHLDALCGRATAFTRTYCQSPICTPSRASFLTGRYPSNVHVARNGSATFPSEPRLIPSLFAAAGYRTGLVGKLHLASAYGRPEARANDGYRTLRYSHDPREPEAYGNAYAVWARERGWTFDDLFFRPEPDAPLLYRSTVDPTIHHTTWCADEAIAFIDDASSEPWFLSVNTFDPHPPFDAPESLTARYRAAGVPPPTFVETDLEHQARLAEVAFQTPAQRPTPTSLERIASYYGMIELIDEQVGRILEALERTGQRESTLVIFMSDHGEMLGDHGLTLKGCRFYEGLVRVPLIVSWPGRFREGVICDELVELTDVAPTLAAVLGTELEPTNGRSLVPALTGQDVPGRAYVRSEYLDALGTGRASPAAGELRDHVLRRTLQADPLPQPRAGRALRPAGRSNRVTGPVERPGPAGAPRRTHGAELRCVGRGFGSGGTRRGTVLDSTPRAVTH